MHIGAIIGLATLGIIVIGAISLLPDFIRYLKIRSMWLAKYSDPSEEAREQPTAAAACGPLVR